MRISGKFFGTALAMAALLAIGSGGSVRGDDQHSAVEGKPGKAAVGEQVVCAHDGMKMSLAAGTPSAEYRGKVLYFCSDEEKATFLRDPEHHMKH
mgnify:CR=1 FL=1